MIKIIKPGQTEFHGVCDQCNCEFTYELDDLKLSDTNDWVACPTCGKKYYHKSTQKEAPEILKDLTWPPEPIPTFSGKTDSCAGCPWKENLLINGPYVGDTPCDFCTGNLYKVTCLNANGKTVGTLQECDCADHI